MSPRLRAAIEAAIAARQEGATFRRVVAALEELEAAYRAEPRVLARVTREETAPSPRRDPRAEPTPMQEEITRRVRRSSSTSLPAAGREHFEQAQRELRKDQDGDDDPGSERDR